MTKVCSIINAVESCSPKSKTKRKSHIIIGQENNLEAKELIQTLEEISMDPEQQLNSECPATTEQDDNLKFKEVTENTEEAFREVIRLVKK